MTTLIRTTSAHPAFQQLVIQLDAFLAHLNGDDQAFFHQFNGIDQLQNVILALSNDQIVGCGAFKPFDKTSVEIKRMFVLPASRGKGIAGEIVEALETWAHELGYAACVLETGTKLPEAIRTYEKAGYQVIPNYGQYIGVELSVCMRKDFEIEINTTTDSRL